MLIIQIQVIAENNVLDMYMTSFEKIYGVMR
jgi:hypothetical protein